MWTALRVVNAEYEHIISAQEIEAWGLKGGVYVISRLGES